jgi:hypothetical protein
VTPTPCHRLVDRVVHHLVDEVVEPALADVADVHVGPLADGLEALEHLDRVGPVLLRSVVAERRLLGGFQGFFLVFRAGSGAFRSLRFLAGERSGFNARLRQASPRDRS